MVTAKYIDQLIEFFALFFCIAARCSLLRAALEAILENPALYFVGGGMNCGNLCQNIDAIQILLNHAKYPVNLTLNAF